MTHRYYYVIITILLHIIRWRKQNHPLPAGLMSTTLCGCCGTIGKVLLCVVWDQSLLLLLCCCSQNGDEEDVDCLGSCYPIACPWSCKCVCVVGHCPHALIIVLSSCYHPIIILSSSQSPVCTWSVHKPLSIHPHLL